MPSWDGLERRKEVRDYNDIIIGLERINQMMEVNHKSFREFQMEMRAVSHKVNSTLYGNGQVGITTKVSNMEQIGQDFKEHDKRDLRIQLSLLVGTLGILAKLLFFN